MRSRINSNRNSLPEHMRFNQETEQDRINRMLISRVKEMHNILVQINRTLVHSRTDLAGFKGGAKSAFMKLKNYHDTDVADVKKELAEINRQLADLKHLAYNNGSRSTGGRGASALIYSAVVFSFLSLALSVWCLSGG